MAMKIFADNTVASAADANEYFVNTKYAEKPSDTTRSSTATVAIDPDLQLQVDANKTYFIEVFLLYHSNGAANFKYSFNAPAGSVLSGAAIAQAGGVLVAISYNPAGTGLAFNTSQVLDGQDPFESAARIAGVLDTAGTAGGFSVRWSQGTSTGFSTALRAGSFMLVRRVS
jgi:hypothetical protein